MIFSKLNLRVPAGKAAPTPAIASSLGPKGVNLMQFCKTCNDLTSGFPPGAQIRVRVIVNTDKTFKVGVKGIASTDIIKSHLKLNKGSSSPGKDFAASITFNDLKMMAQESIACMNTRDVEAAIKTIAGKIKSMGVKISDERREV